MKADASGYSFGGGPRVFLTRSHNIISPFVDTLLSFGHASADVSTLGTTLTTITVNGFGLDAGAGADFRVSDTFSIRVRPGYSMSRAEGETSHGFALISGIVFHFGPAD